MAAVDDTIISEFLDFKIQCVFVQTESLGSLYCA